MGSPTWPAPAGDEPPELPAGAGRPAARRVTVWELIDRLAGEHEPRATSNRRRRPRHARRGGHDWWTLGR